ISSQFACYLVSHPVAYGPLKLRRREKLPMTTATWQELLRDDARTMVMGIINATPDSFSGDGIYAESETVSAAVALAEAQITAGADILDIGGESTRPGSDIIDAHTEKSRILPVIEEIKGRHPDVALSVDTYRAEVAAAALDRGADIINDVWAARADPDMASVMAERGVPVVLMHNRSRPNAILSEGRIGGEYIGAEYSHVVDDVIAELAQLVDELLAAKVARGQIALDPGIGFGKTVDQNLALLRHLDILKASLDLPFLIGTSRKSFIGRILDLPVEDRLEGTAATVAAGILQGADIVRVHDVREMIRVVRVIDRLKVVLPNGEVAG
ncbi:MAG: dihydropteroate synthase, partial [Pseudomonadota bacterium]|nr:dihydropteroate synthase [Pseudomonadota bacterium]